MKDFVGKIVVITGGSTGIGAAAAKKFVEQGAKVYVLGMNKPSNIGDYLQFIKCDVTKYADIRFAIQKIFNLENRIDHLFANAGAYLIANIEETSVDDLNNIIDINLKGVFLVLKEVLPIMRVQGYGSIVVTGSDQSFIGKPNSAIYGATKGAIGLLTKGVGIDYAQFGIRINCVCPGTTETPMYNKAIEAICRKNNISKDVISKKLAEAQPMGRIGKPEEVAEMVLFLCSDKSSFTTGALYSVDGGFTAM
ncbi:MAG: SDR family oxidoreductase [Gammaproteobacteria bacterium]